MWGDAALWYLLAEANGLTNGSATLQAGQVLSIPAKVGNVHNTASTFKPYDPNRALGDVNPTEPKPPAPQQGGKCGTIGKVLVVVVAVAVTVMTKGLLAKASTGLLKVIGSSAVASGAVAGAAGALAGQGFGVAAGIQDKIDWKGIGLAALSGGIAGGLAAEGNPFEGLFKGIESAAGKTAAAAAQGATANVLTQGVATATGLQHKFDWTGVAVAAVSAGTAHAVGGHVAQWGGQSKAHGFAANLATGMAAATTGAATQSLLTGNSFGDTLIATLPQTIGATLGNMIGGQLLARAEAQAEAPARGGRPFIDFINHRLEGMSPLSADSLRGLMSNMSALMKVADPKIAFARLEAGVDAARPRDPLLIQYWELDGPEVMTDSGPMVTRRLAAAPTEVYDTRFATFKGHSPGTWRVHLPRDANMSVRYEVQDGVLYSQLIDHDRGTQSPLFSPDQTWANADGIGGARWGGASISYQANERGPGIMGYFNMNSTPQGGNGFGSYEEFVAARDYFHNVTRVEAEKTIRPLAYIFGAAVGGAVAVPVTAAAGAFVIANPISATNATTFVAEVAAGDALGGATVGVAVRGAAAAGGAATYRYGDDALRGINRVLDDILPGRPRSAPTLLSLFAGPKVIRTPGPVGAADDVVRGLGYQADDALRMGARAAASSPDDILRAYGVRDATLRQSLLNTGFNPAILDDASTATLARFDRLFQGTLDSNKGFRGRLGNLSTRARTIETAVEIDRMGLIPEFESMVRLPNGQVRFVDVAALNMDPQPVAYWQLYKADATGQIPARELTARSDIYHATGIAPTMVRTGQR